MTTFKNAQETTVFVFDNKNQIIETTYADHVLESADETTHSTGVRRCLDVEELENGNFAVVSRNCFEPGFKIKMEFDNLDDANDYWFNQIEKSDFQRDDQRNTMYFSYYEDALKNRAEDVLAYDLRVSNDTALSIARKEQILIKAGRI